MKEQQVLKVYFPNLEKTFLKLVENVKRDENEWKLTTWREPNCYIVEAKSGDITVKEVMEADEKDELKMHERLLYYNMNFFAFGGSKHDPERIDIVRRKNK